MIGKSVKPYQGAFPQGSRVRVRTRLQLEHFQSDWHWHHPLETSQLEYAGAEALIETVGFYHGGDVLYTLYNVPGTWHEACLEAAPEIANGVVLADARFQRRPRLTQGITIAWLLIASFP